MESIYKTVNAWFENYVNEFPAKDPEHAVAYHVKIVHSRYVADEMKALSRSLNLNEREAGLAAVIGLLHDAGRFEQFLKYQTFKDRDSADHAELACNVIEQHHLLKNLESRESEIAMYAIRHHNKKELPDDSGSEMMQYARMIRDADKIDIFRVVCDYYESDDGHEAIGLDLPDSPEMSPAVVDAVRQGQMVRMHDLHNLNDFKLLQMAWVYDLNFTYTFKAVRERRFLQQIARTLPKNEVVEAVLYQTSTYVNRHCF